MPMPTRWGILDTMATSSQRTSLPWSHRQSAPIRTAVTTASAVASALIGTMAHRMGAVDNIPYGLALALLLVLVSAWCSRSRQGVAGLAWHLTVSSTVTWFMSQYGPGGDVVIPIGFSVPMPYFTEYAGYFWLFGIILIQVILLLVPSKCFVIPEADGIGNDKRGARSRRAGTSRQTDVEKGKQR
ncbi:alcohol dehydrogenase [Bifidobacterium tsurumiense]